MQKLVLIRPGQVSDWVALVDVLREAHEEQAEERKKEIARRAEKGIPLDDDTDWAAVDAAVAAKDSAKVAALTSGNALAELPPFEAPRFADQVKLRIRAVSENTRRAAMMDVAAAVDAIAQAIAGKHFEALPALQKARDAVFGEFIKLSVAELHVGEEAFVDVDDALVDALQATDLLAPIFAAARDYQRLSRGKGARFGSLQPSI